MATNRENTISYTDLFMMDESEIRNIIKVGETSTYAFFKVILKNNTQLMCGPIQKESKTNDYGYVIKKMKTVRENNSGYKTIESSYGTIKNYNTKKRKTKRSNMGIVAAIGLSTALGFGAATLAKSDIDVKDVYFKTMSTLLDKFEEARLAGTLTDDKIADYYYQTNDDAGLQNFRNYQIENETRGMHR